MNVGTCIALTALLVTSLSSVGDSTSAKLKQTPRQDQVVRSVGNHSECGDPMLESMLWAISEGRVVSIVNDSTIRIDSGGSTFRTIRLAMIHPPDRSSQSGNNTSSFLEHELLGKHVTVMCKMSDRDSSTAEGLVALADTEFNSLMLEKGVAFFRPPQTNEFGWYIPCLYRQREKHARENRLGIWKRPE
jgi:endonuclease YncB( thermonuclease family)